MSEGGTVDENRILDKLDQIEGIQRDMLSALVELKTKDVEQEKKVGDHEARIRSLEVWKYGLPVTGLVAVGSMALSAWKIVGGA